MSSKVGEDEFVWIIARCQHCADEFYREFWCIVFVTNGSIDAFVQSRVLGLNTSYS